MHEVLLRSKQIQTLLLDWRFSRYAAFVQSIERPFNMLLLIRSPPHIHCKSPKETYEAMCTQIGGMTCSACSSAVEQALLGLQGVSKVSVSLLTGKAEVRQTPCPYFRRINLTVTAPTVPNLKTHEHLGRSLKHA